MLQNGTLYSSIDLFLLCYTESESKTQNTIQNRFMDMGGRNAILQGVILNGAVDASMSYYLQVPVVVLWPLTSFRHK